jgi:hypothetical protein
MLDEEDFGDGVSGGLNRIFEVEYQHGQTSCPSYNSRISDLRFEKEDGTLKCELRTMSGG